MKNTEEMYKVISDIEKEMVEMWSTGEATQVLNTDPALIKIMLVAVFYERNHFRELGMEVGEA